MSRIFSILQTTKRRLGFLGRVQDLSHKFNDTGITDLIITGDFNFPHIDWSTISLIYLNTQVESFCDILTFFLSK